MEVQRSNELKERAVELGKRQPAIGLLFGGFLVMFWGFLEASLVRQLRRNGSTAEGTVLRNVRSTDPNIEGPYWMPVIAFTDAAGDRVEFSPQATGTGLTLSTGSTVEVIYLRGAAQDARVNTRAHLSRAPRLAIIGGLVFQAIVTTVIVVFGTAMLGSLL